MDDSLAVATAPPSVTDAIPAADNAAAAAATAGSTTTAASSSSSATAASFIYPTTDLTINNIDDIIIQYESPWQDLSLTVSCKGDGVGGAKSYDISLSQQDGTYRLTPIDGEITVSDYPVDCSLILQDSDSVANFLVGPDFTVQSTGGVASVYAASATRPAAGDSRATSSGSGAAATETPDGAPEDSGSSESSASGRGGSEATSTSVSGASTSSSSDAGAGASAGGLSGGAKAGIAIGVILAVALVALALFYAFRTQRRMAVMENELQETKKQHETDRAYVDGILKAAGKPDTRNGGRVVMAEAPTRGSGDWKNFFGASRAGTPLTAPPSRLGRTVQTPSPAPRSSIGGDAGSTVGLVGR